MKKFAAVLFTTGNQFSCAQVYNTEKEAKDWVATYVGMNGQQGYNYTGGAVYKMTVKAERPVPLVEWTEIK